MVLYKVVQGVEIHVGEELTRLVPNRDTPTSFAGSEQIIAWEPLQNWLLPVAVVDDQVNQPKNIWVFDLVCHQVFEDLMIQRWKELTDVGFQDVTKASGEMLRAVDCGVCSLAFSTSVRIGNEATLEDRLQNAGQSMMNDAITIGGALISRRFGS